MTKAILMAFALATLAMTINGAFAVTNVKGSRSNAASFKACVDGGGTVKTDSKGNQDCTPKKK